MRKSLFAPLLCSLFLLGCPGSEPTPTHTRDGAHSPDDGHGHGSAEPEKVPDDLKPTIKDVKVGAGATVENGDMACVIYTGKLKDGKVFDSNAGKDKNPFSFFVGSGQVIAGWDRGIPGMKVGGKRTLEIPAILGYGKAGSGPIPPDSDLIFDVDLLYVVKKGQEMEYEATDLKIGTGKEAKSDSTVQVLYNGTLLNGKKFDARLDPKEPFEFQLGVGAVIKGWDDGIVGMKVGGKRRLIIPPALAYGPDQKGENIPPNSVLVFEVELLGIK